MRLKPVVLLPVFLVSTVAYAATPGAYYEADDPNPAPLKYPDAQLQATLAQVLKNNKVTTLKNLQSGVTELTKLSHPEKIAVLYVGSAKPGAEMDVLVEEGGKFIPIEVFWEADTVSFRSGAPRASIYGKASTKEEL